MDASTDALPYTSPSIVTILVLASYLLFLSIFYHAFQKLFSAGILGPLVLGAIYARPLGNILPEDVQSAILAIGYLGLILLIVQGGLEARMDILSSPKNLAMALLVGATGVVLPIGISMALLPLGFGYGFLESFAVGAALASTSLGTTFAVLSSFNGSSDKTAASENVTGDANAENGIAHTRIGTILVGAALLDDIVGLVITSVITTLGSSSSESQHGSSGGGGVEAIKPWTIARPIVSSFLLLVVSWLLTQFALAPLARRVVVPYISRLAHAAQTQFRFDEHYAESRPEGHNEMLKAFYANRGLQQLVATTLLISTVLAYSVISEEIGSSLLIGAFCAGAMIKYLYALWQEEEDKSSALHAETVKVWSPDYLLSTTTALGVVQDTILMPFFFSSIGSAIPVKSMFQGTTVWRGIIFAGLMAFAKVCAGSWVLLADLLEHKWSQRRSEKQAQKHDSRQHDNVDDPTSLELQPSPAGGGAVSSALASPLACRSPTQAEEVSVDSLAANPSPATVERPLVWPAALFLGTALMSRGEIGFLVINIARQGGLVDQQAFNVGIWAIVLNTLAGPVSIGILMRSKHAQSIMGRAKNSHLGRWC
ncbi:uncharacterized protein UTRI_06622_B [Ustilago trichophora]|uniref:Cation/H+ exchanger transmembrane domain-containing protein n=1 Tax=Ustilago trichophora TaxID=86804 RepID=A0A5C3EQV2_9BASI|nr:uncharacterized protein UTRI_06622_B [Ustilago trichophora]